MRVWLRVALLSCAAVALVVLARPATAQEGAPRPSADEPLRRIELPARDPMDLAVRFGRVADEDIARVVSAEPLAAAIGRVDRFWVLARGPERYHEISAVLRHIGDHAYWYVEQGLSVEPSTLRQAAMIFDQRLYPLVRRYFGTEWLPGIDGDPRLTILLAEFPSVLAYHSSSDEYPRGVLGRSNEREMLYLNPRALGVGTPGFFATLAHELQHLIQWRVQPDQDTWILEGAAELASSLAGYAPPSVREFERQPDIPLLGWSEEPSASIAHYRASYLFFHYVLERFLAPDELYPLLAVQQRGAQLFEQYLAARGQPATFDEIFRDWVAANFLDPYAPGGGRLGYRGLDVRAQVAASLRVGGEPYQGEVQQYGADYVELVGEGGEVEVEFQGAAATPLVAAPGPVSGGVWWSNRGDNIDTRLTRAFDLRGLQAAELRLRLWFDTEQDYDYGYVAVSTDGGRRWTPLCLGVSTREDPTGNNFGCGFSGKSGGGAQAEWVEERADLSPFVGQEVLLRLEYVTDQSYSGRGMVVDQVRIPELGFVDDADADQGWELEGFARVHNLVSQDYAVQLLLVRNGQPEVVEVPLDESRRGRARVSGLGSEVSRAVVAVSGLNRWSLEAAPYTLEVRRAE